MARRRRERRPPRTVHVVGAGPAGLELARVAAGAGHDVHVHDRRDRPGGVVPDWALAAGRDSLAGVVPWLVAECERSGVRFHLGAEVGAADVQAWEDGGGTVVLCTGGRDPDDVPYDVDGAANVTAALGALGALAGGPPVLGPLVVWDPVGGPVAISVAETFAPATPVTLVTPDLIAGTLLSLTGDLAAASTRLQQAGVTIMRRHRLLSVGAGTATVEDVFTGATTTVDAATVVDAGHRVPDDHLWQATGGRLGARRRRRGPPDGLRGGARGPARRARARRAARHPRRRGPPLMPPSTRYPRLFSPMRIGPVTVPNRIVFAAHLTNYAEDGRPTQQHAAYYGARAAGGAGLVITEEHSVHPTDWPYEKMIHGFDPGVVPGYRAITDAVHRHDVPVFAQINHNGGQASSMYTRLPVWAPSPVPDPLFREVPKAVDHAEIAEVVAGYATVAAHCREGGFDGVELQCSHSSIVRGFLSRATNRRDDGYGGSLEHRARLLVEVVRAVRGAIGPGMALGVRLCGDELIEHGITIDEAVDTARIVDATGAVDYVNTSIGVATATLFMIEASMHVPPGYALFIPSAIRAAVPLPVVGVGRFKDPLQAERALDEGHCDLVGVVRGQIADADFAAKARAGLTEDIRLCLSCNQECVGRMGLNRWLGCIENPRTGREAELGVDGRAAHGARPVRRARQPKRRPGRCRSPDPVLVAGAGPAGLQAAVAAAERGHSVVVHESGNHAGGQLALAASVPNRAELGDLVRNQLRACSRLGVEIVYGSTVDAAMAASSGADAVVVATGARPAPPWWAPPDPAIPLVDVRDVLSGRHHPAGRVMVFDELGFHQATSVAELLADRGCAVEIVTPGMVVGQDLGITLDMEQWWIRASAKGIVQTTDTLVTGLDGADVLLLHHPTGHTEARAVDHLVLSLQPAPADDLYLSCRAAGLVVERAGDCVAPRRAHAAVLDGQRIGSSL